jgi:hypothetical protein
MTLGGTIASFLGTAAAMDFSTQLLPDRDRYVLAKGEIIAGDAERLRFALKAVERDRYGNNAMALDSAGGLVGDPPRIPSGARWAIC